MFSAFMESFNAAVGIPPERASESVFQFDGDNLNPKGTPEVSKPGRCCLLLRSTVDALLCMR